MNVSVIIPTFNRDKLLQRTLKSIADHLIKQNVELIIVDNNSTDQTKKITENFIKNHKSLNAKYIFEPVPGLLAGRHRGYLEAKGEILSYLDDDVIISKTWLEGVKDAFNNPNVHLATGPSFPFHESSPPSWLDYFWNRKIGLHICPYLSLIWQGDEEKECDPEFVWGLNYSIRKDTVFKAGGFHPDCIPGHLQHFQGDGESGLSQKVSKLGYKCIYHPKISLHHIIAKERLTKDYFKKRFYYEGIVNSYADIRRNRRVLPKTQTINKEKETECFSKKYWQKFRHPRSSIRWFLQQKRYIKRPNMNSTLTEEEKLKYEFHQAYLYGYNFHKEMVNTSPDLLKWVLQEDYFDYQLPHLKGFSN